MCGRYATTRSAAELGALFEAYDDTDGRLRPDWNVAPTKPVPVVRADAEGARALCVAHWGLLPPWAATPAVGSRMINARVETVATKRAYAVPFARRRCLVPVDGWYEWARSGGRRQPYYLTPSDGGVIAFAGIWSRWQASEGPRLTFSVLTTSALGALAQVHDRMPVVLPASTWGAWLAPSDDPRVLLSDVDQDWLAGLEIRPVGPAVGNVRNEGPGLTARVPGVPTPGGVPPAAEMTLF